LRERPGAIQTGGAQGFNKEVADEVETFNALVMDTGVPADQAIARSDEMRTQDFKKRKDSLTKDATDIEDNGPGIPQELLETVFYPLVTSKNSGSGIGLTIAQELVSSNGGLIEFESRPGRTVFRVRLPVQNASAARNA
jgi:nitrogen-specific signal transduction histidine kinase